MEPSTKNLYGASPSLLIQSLMDYSRSETLEFEKVTKKDKKMNTEVAEGNGWNKEQDRSKIGLSNFYLIFFI